VLAVGAAGNAWIMASVYNIILNVIDGGMSAQQAIEAPRFLIGRDPAENDVARIQIEDRFPRSVLADLEARGHRFQKIGRKGEVRYGYAAAVVVDTARREVQGGAEPRRSHAARASLIADPRIPDPWILNRLIRILESSNQIHAANPRILEESSCRRRGGVAWRVPRGRHGQQTRGIAVVSEGGPILPRGYCDP
jgi:hypothetical protein